jgi:heat shock protein HslJ
MITTWIQDSQLNIPTTDKHIDELLEKVREQTHEDWQIDVVKIKKKRTFWSKPSEPLYEIYFGIGGSQYQMINFYVGNSQTSINTVVTKDLVMAYLYGILAGNKK